MNPGTKNIGRSCALYLLLLSTIGPNIGLGLRMEHVVVYPLFLTFLLVCVWRKSLILPKVFWLPVILLGSCLYCVLGDMYVSPDARMANYLASLGRLIEPPVLFFVFYFILKDKVSETLFKNGCFLTVIVACMATIISLISMLQPDNIILNLYSLGEDSVGSASHEVGRYLGVFNQPLEAGVFFSVALFCLYYLRQRTVFWWGWELMLFCIISVGGMLTLSKNFYLLGYGSVAVYLLTSNRRLFYKYIITLFVLLVSGIVLVINFNSSFVMSYTELYEQFGIISALSAGRFGSEGSVTPLFNSVIENGLFTGMGLGTYMPLDSGYLEYFYHGGVIALAFYVVFIAALVVAGLSRTRPQYLSQLQLGLGLFLIAASLGGPVLTANRACVALMFLIAGSFAVGKPTELVPANSHVRLGCINKLSRRGLHVCK